jgi:NTE family protein
VLAALAAAIQTLSCAHFPVNEPLEHCERDYGYRVGATSGDTDDSQQVLLMVTFSGGGTRAAALAYGVLRALAEAKVEFDGRERALVDEIDILSSVSGGSFAAAYFALHGRRTFDDFESRFLKRNIQAGLIWRMLAPWSWPRLASPWFGRSDLAAEYYDDVLFDDARFGDLLNGDGPALLINATDMTLATVFAFDQDQFDLICSDSLSFPISRAVAASSAVPAVFSPITLESYAARGCGYEPPDWVGEELARTYAPTRRHQEARRIGGYMAATSDFYVHLLDGSLADSLGLRLTLERSVGAGGYSRLSAEAGFKRFRRLVYVVVNAQTESVREWSDSSVSPGIFEQLGSASTATLNRYNYETVELFRRTLEHDVADLRSARCRPDADVPPEALSLEDCGDIASHFIEVAFAQHPDPEERAYLSALPTTLRLSDEQVERSIAAGRAILAASPEFQALLEDLAALPAPRAPVAPADPVAGPEEGLAP